MSLLQYKKIIADRHRDEMVGRAGETERLLSHARGTGGGLAVSAAPRVGLTEILQQAYDELFATETEVVPIYFRFRRDSESASESARRFAREFLTQFVAFRRRDPFAIHVSPGVAELQRMALPQDHRFIEEVIGIVSGSDVSDVHSFVRAGFSLPIRAATRGIRTCVFLDDVQNAPGSFGADEIVELYRRIDSPFVIAARRRLAFNSSRMQRMDLSALSFEDSGMLAQWGAQRSGLEMTDAVRDLAALRCDGDLVVMSAIIDSAVRRSEPLDSFRAFETAYAESIFGGGVSRLFDQILADVSPVSIARSQVIQLLADSFASEGGVASVDVWLRRTGLPEDEFVRMLDRLNIEEIVRVSSNRVEAMRENRVLSDHIKTKFRLESGSESRAAVFADVLSAAIKEAPVEMAEHYRRASAIGLREVMSSFQGKTVPTALVQYGHFRDHFKGMPAGEMLTELASSTDHFPLPQIVFSAHTDSFYRAIGMTTERERSALAIGFEQGDLGGENRTAWIAAEIDSKLEASENVTASWCERLEMAATASGFLQHKLWLVAPEGFSPEALDLLERRNGIGTSRKQVELLKEFLVQGAIAEPVHQPEEYEIVIPMSGDAELVAAHTLEDIARRHKIPVKEVNRIKTALVEACINASEHSKSPDRRIHQKFSVGRDQISITVSNRGVRLVEKAVPAEPSEGRRGWGLRLMRQLMDEVRIENVDDGTRILMIKYFQPA